MKLTWPFSPLLLLLLGVLLPSSVLSIRLPMVNSAGNVTFRHVMGVGAPVPRREDQNAPPRPGTANCDEKWFTQTADHFTFNMRPETFQQRYFVCKADGVNWKAGDPILFYTGNEASVEMYVNNTGLMWENAGALNALMIFMEHRFYGKSQINNGRNGQGLDQSSTIHLLTMEQALADYARAIYELKKEMNAQRSAVIALGGSYGGMLSSWLRMKYPWAIQGAIAASAPILAFKGFEQFPTLNYTWDSNAYWRVVTRDATPAGGAVAGCDMAVKSTWKVVEDLSKTEAGRQQLIANLHLCPSDGEVNFLTQLQSLLLNAWDTYAMANYPYPCDYFSFGTNASMPAFPMRAACKEMTAGNGTAAAAVVSDNDASEAEQTSAQQTLLQNLLNSISFLYNITRKEKCFPLPTDIEQDGIWDYQWCTEMMPQETYFTLTGTSDMFWDQPMSMTFINAHCSAKYNGLVPRPEWIAQEFGGTGGVSNIIFSNGGLDPWSSAGVLQNSSSVYVVSIPDGAHHEDLMFSDPRDLPDVVAARKLEISMMKQWIKEYEAQSRS